MSTKNYAKDLEEDLKNAIPDRVFITHSECDAKTGEKIRVVVFIRIENKLLEGHRVLRVSVGNISDLK